MAQVGEHKLRAYLLGQLAEAEEEEVELRLLTDPDFAEEHDMVVNEITDDYVAGKFEEAELQQVEDHFFKSSERRDKLTFALALKERKSDLSKDGKGLRRSWFNPYLAIAASLLLVAGGVYIWRLSTNNAELNKGLAALQSAFRDERPLEARISKFDYAPYLATRGPGEARVDQNELSRAELNLLEALKQKPTPDVHHALGKVFLAKKDFDRGIEQFDEALKGDSRNAMIFSDLGAAWLEKGKIDRSNGRANPGSPDIAKVTEDFARSVENLNKALELNPNLWEALFNRALVREEMSLLPQAEEDWRRYLDKDPNSKWADEVRRHLQELDVKQKVRSQVRKELLKEFMKAYQARDEGRVFDLLSTNTEAIGGELMWWQLAEAALNVSAERRQNRGDSSAALAYAGSVQEQKTGDRFLSALSRFYSDATDQQQASLAEAHSMINEAHALMAKSEVAEALGLYRKAKALFDTTGDEAESLFAAYWIGYSHYRQSDFKEGQSILLQLAERCKGRSFLSLLEKALTMVANMQLESSQYSKSIATYRESLQISTKMNDVYNVQKNLSSLANGYRSLGERQESLAYLERCLESSETYWTGPRQMFRNYYAAASVLNSFGYHAAAAEYEKAALRLALQESDPVFQNQSYVALAAIYTKLKDYSEALNFANLSYQAAKKMDDRTNLRQIGDAFLHLGHVNRQLGDYGQALTYYDQAIKSYEGGNFALLYEAHKGKLLDYIAENKDPEAKDELRLVLALFEEHRWKIREESNRNSFFDMQQNVYDVAIDFEYSRLGNPQKAFEYSEASRARSLLDMINANARITGDDDRDPLIQPADLKSIREQIPEQVQILQYAVLDDKLLAWVVSKNKFETVALKIDASGLAEKVVSYCKLLSSGAGSDSEEFRRAGMELYQILISPVESLLEKDKQIYVVPDKVLNSLAFNALISPTTGRYLVNDYLFAMAPSSNVFVVCTKLARDRSERPDERLLSVGNPYFDYAAFPDIPELPSSGEEAAAIANYYPSAHLLVGDQATKDRVRLEMNKADVIHLASHYVVNEQNPMLSRLLLTRKPEEGSESTSGVLQALEISETKLPITRLVTLSACRTGVERYYGGEGMIGMSRSFLAAGVPTVVASLWPVASDPTADLMTNLHRFRKQNHMSTAQALRQSQLDMIASQKSQPYYWASFVLIGGYANF